MLLLSYEKQFVAGPEEHEKQGVFTIAPVKAMIVIPGDQESRRGVPRLRRYCSEKLTRLHG